MKKIVFLSLALLLSSVTLLQGQTLDELKTKVMNSGQNPKKKKASKEVYISNFKVLVEVYREDRDKKAKREFRGKGRGEATAFAALGLQGLQPDLLQLKVDALYNEMIADLKSKGFTIIGSDRAATTSFYKNASSLKGPLLRESANPGFLEIIPSGFDGFATKREAEGKASKKSGFLSRFKAVGDVVSGGNNQLSKQMDDAIILDINLVLSWSESGGSWLKSLGGANARIKTNLALGDKAVQAVDEDGFFKGVESVYDLKTDFNLSQGSGLKKVVWKGYLKKPLYISGVIDPDTEVESYNRGAVSKSYEVGIYKITEWTSTISENAKMVTVDAQKFAEALYLAGDAFLDDQLIYLFDKYL